MSDAPDEQRIDDFLASVANYESWGLYELNVALHELYKARQLGIGVRDMAHIERYWLWTPPSHSSAGYILLLHDGRRVYLDVWIQQVVLDGSEPPDVEIEVKLLPEGRRLPDFPSKNEPLGGWRNNVGVLNEFLFNAWQSQEPLARKKPDESGPGWRPMSEFDPSKPALVHDRLNDQTIDWEPERHGTDYKAGHRNFGDGVIEWDGLLLDRWKPQ